MTNPAPPEVRSPADLTCPTCGLPEGINDACPACVAIRDSIGYQWRSLAIQVRTLTDVIVDTVPALIRPTVRRLLGRDRPKG